MAERAASEYGKVDILINNAGVSQLSYTATEDLSKAEWDSIIGINLTGTFLCCKNFGKGFNSKSRSLYRNIDVNSKRGGAKQERSKNNKGSFKIS